MWTSRSGCWTTPSTRCPPVETRSAAAYVEVQVDGQVFWGVGVDPNIVTASLRAISAAINRPPH